MELKFQVNVEPSKFLCVIFIGLVSLCCFQYWGYTRLPSYLKPTSFPPIKPSTHQQIDWKSYFIYQAPTNLKLVSLTYNCPKCRLPCSNVSEGISETCKGKACLCNKLSPIITFPKFRDNSAYSDDYMLEAEKDSLDTKHITDLLALPNITNSQVKLLRSGYTHKIGDRINIILSLVNGYGKKLFRGGDDIRVSMTEKKLKNSIVGTVHDYKNGTYLITIPVLWEGNNTISISINYFQEEKAAIFRWYRQFGALFYHYGRFRRNQTEQLTLCAATPHLEGYKEICNVSLYNDGDPWYCGKPPSNKLGCNDIVMSFDHRFIDLPVTEVEEKLFKRTCSDTKRTLPQIQFKTRGGKYNPNDLPHCSQVNPAETWKTDEANGYFLHDNYYSTKCQSGPSRPNITRCLQNTRLILHGDSTVLQWIKLLKQISGCSLNSNYSGGKWYEEMICEKKELGFTLKFAPHNMPFSCFQNREHKVAPATKSIETVLNEIPTTGRTIFVFHFGAHFTRQHYNVFRYKIIQFKNSLKKALSRNKDLTILIKGPHMFLCTVWVPSLHDALIPDLITILLDELREFSDRIFYLNYYDMSVAVKNKDMHAGQNFIKNMIETMLTYTCK